MIKEKAYAKINLGLDIIRKRSDGYHDIDTIMQTVSLYDDIYLKKHPGIIISCSDPNIPLHESNTAYKAAMAFFKKHRLDISQEGVHIIIEKHIPSQAGLGGGSSDAAAVLRGLNKLYCTNYGTSILGELALEVGSDVPFCINGGTQRARGRGEELTELPLFEKIYFVIAMPDEFVDTAHAYSLYKDGKSTFHPNIDSIETALNERNFKKLCTCLNNAFEELIFPEKPGIVKTKHDILDTGASAALMTGSGAAVYGIFDSQKKAQSAFTSLKGKYRVYLAKPLGGIF